MNITIKKYIRFYIEYTYIRPNFYGGNRINKINGHNKNQYI